jgi:hypothetical protein
MFGRRQELRIGFSKLLKLPNPHSRGKQFEKLLADLMGVEGCEVSLNSAAAKPRQTDFAINCVEGPFMAEAKWKKGRVDVGDIDSLRSRIRRGVPGTWGCLFSMSDYSKTALDELLRDKALPILPFNAAEINLLFNGKLSFLEVLRRKKADLRDKSKLLFVNQKGAQPHASFRPATEQVRCGKRQLDWWECEATEYDLVYPRSRPYVSWNSDSPQAVTTGVDVSSVGDLERVFLAASKALDLSGNGTFTIYQENRNWHGIGMGNWLKCISDWERRYASQSWDSYHHSEELAYFEQFDVGMFAISGRQRVGESSFLHSFEVEFLLPGVPIDTDPYKTFIQIAGADSPFFYQKRDPERSVIHLKPSVRLEVRGLIVSSEFERSFPSISGVVATNPFFRADMKSLLGERYVPEAEWAAESLILFCHLNDWITYGTEVDEYKLMNLSFAQCHVVKLVVRRGPWSLMRK